MSKQIMPSQCHLLQISILSIGYTRKRNTENYPLKNSESWHVRAEIIEKSYSLLHSLIFNLNSTTFSQPPQISLISYSFSPVLIGSVLPLDVVQSYMISILCSNLDLTNSPFYFGVLLTFQKKYSLKIKLRRKDKLLHFPNKLMHCVVLSWHIPPKQQEDLLLHVCKSAALISVHKIQTPHCKILKITWISAFPTLSSSIKYL